METPPCRQILVKWDDGTELELWDPIDSIMTRSMYRLAVELRQGAITVDQLQRTEAERDVGTDTQSG